MTIGLKYRNEFLYCYNYDDLQSVDGPIYISNVVSLLVFQTFK